LLLDLSNGARNVVDDERHGCLRKSVDGVSID
jgi:hypothetical protein